MGPPFHHSAHIYSRETLPQIWQAKNTGTPVTLVPAHSEGSDSMPGQASQDHRLLPHSALRVVLQRFSSRERSNSYGKRAPKFSPK